MLLAGGRRAACLAGDVDRDAGVVDSGA